MLLFRLALLDAGKAAADGIPLSKRSGGATRRWALIERSIIAYHVSCACKSRRRHARATPN
eukprot:COSAG03_NODE_1061_length_4928_cov_1084.029613_9_plen_61_part_00